MPNYIQIHQLVDNTARGYAKIRAVGKLLLEADTAAEARDSLGVLIAKHYNHDQKWQRKSGDNSVIQSPNEVMLRIDDNSYYLSAQIELDVDVANDWDTTSGTDYSTAANRAGKDFYVYAVQPNGGDVPDFVLSANSTVPSGYTASNSRKVAGFHCLCADVGTIASHTLTDYLQGDILPASVWDLFHRPISNPEGMVYSALAGIWVDIYLASGTGSSTVSENGATISDTRDWLSFVDDFAAVKKQLLSDTEFQVIADGSNEETNISGSADPVTTGGHSDTAARRMISNIGCEDCAGALWQWLRTPSMRADFDIGLDSGDMASAGWYDLPGSKGSFYTYGTNKYMNTQLHAGGTWTPGSDCGSRARSASAYRWHANSAVGGRGRSEPRASRFI